MSRQWPRLHPRHRANRDIAPPCLEGLESQHEGEIQRPRRETAESFVRFMEFFDGAQSWSRVERIIARVEAGAEGPDTRFVVTNLRKRNARRLYEGCLCAGAAMPKTISSPGRPIWRRIARPCSRATANQFRLFLHAGAYWLMWGLRVSMPEAFDVARRPVRHVAPPACIKIAARVVEMKTMIRGALANLSMPRSGYTLRFALGRIPRLVI